ncbi:MAG: hypothetical protein E4H36_12600 [Spirochaetales bacterium]|nr:MAG: hypothetical protein E4H36_12600 [Spirochaetales bacterium]
MISTGKRKAEKLLAAYFAEKLLREPGPAYPESSGPAGYSPGAASGPQRREKAAPIMLAAVMAACLAVFFLNRPFPAPAGRASLRTSVHAAAVRLNTQDTFPEGIKKINEYFSRHYKPGGTI